MAKKTAQVDIKVTGGQSIQDIENELNAVNEQLKTMDVNSQAFAEMAEQAQQLDGQLQSVNQELSYISPAEQADGFLKMGEGIGGAMLAVEGLSAAFGDNNEAMQESIKKIVGLIGALDGVRKVSEALQKENLAKMARGFQSVGKAATTGFRAVEGAIGNVTKSFQSYVGITGKGVKIMNTALTGFIITAVLVALTIAIQQVIKNWDKLVGIFSKSKAALNQTNKEFEDLEKNIRNNNEQLKGLVDEVNNLNNALNDLSTLDAKDIFDDTQLQKYRDAVNAARVQVSKFGDDSIEALQAEKDLADARVAFQTRYNQLVREGNDEVIKQYGEVETIINRVSTLEDEEIKAKQLLATAQFKYNEALYNRNEAEAQWLSQGASKNKVARKIKDEEAALLTTTNALSAAQENLIGIQDTLTTARENFNKVSSSEIIDENTIALNEFLNASKDAQDAINAYRLSKQKEADAKWLEEAKKNLAAMQKYQEDNPLQIDIEINEASLKEINITPTVDPTEWEKFIMNVKMDVGEIKFNTEQWGSSISQFSTTYLEPLANEFNNIIMANADLYAAEQENVMALAQLKIDANQEVIDAEMENQEKLQDLIDDNNDQILDYESLLADANAERYAEIQASIVEEQQANAGLQLQKDESDKKELAAIKAKEKAEYEMALATWKIKKNDLEAAKVTAVVNGALAVINALGNPFPLNIVMPILIGIATAVQVAAINKNISAIDKAKPQPPKAAKGMLVGPSHEGGGIPIEAEGGEFIVNKRATAEYLPLIEAINNSGNRPKYADGGQVTAVQPTETNAGINYDELAAAIARSVQPVVSVVQITDAQNKVRVIENNASL